MLTLPTWLVVALHVVFGLLEAVGWTGMARRLGYDPEQTEATRVLALNQGAYNLGVAALLAWALATGQTATVAALLVFVVAMGIVGALSAQWTILLAQGLPAAIALTALLLG